MSAFRTNPRELIERMVRNTMGYAARPNIAGTRVKERTVVDGVEARPGDYIVRLSIDGKPFCSSVNRSWRKAYAGIVAELRVRLPRPTTLTTGGARLGAPAVTAPQVERNDTNTGRR